MLRVITKLEHTSLLRLDLKLEKEHLSMERELLNLGDSVGPSSLSHTCEARILLGVSITCFQHQPFCSF